MVQNRYFTKNKERVGKKSGKPRGKYKKHAKAVVELSLETDVATEEKKKKQEFPNISLGITEKVGNIRITPPKHVSWKMGGFLLFFLTVLGLSVWQGTIVVEKGLLLKDVVAKRSVLMQEMKLWEGIATKYPGYRDAYFQAAVLAYRLGDREKETLYLSKAMEIDPNYLPAKNLERISE